MTPKPRYAFTSSRAYQIQRGARLFDLRPAFWPNHHPAPLPQYPAPQDSLKPPGAAAGGEMERRGLDLRPFGVALPPGPATPARLDPEKLRAAVHPPVPEPFGQMIRDAHFMAQDAWNQPTATVSNGMCALAAAWGDLKRENPGVLDLLALSGGVIEFGEALLGLALVLEARAHLENDYAGVMTHGLNRINLTRAVAYNRREAANLRAKVLDKLAPYAAHPF